MLYIMLAYLMLLAALSTAVCLHSASFLPFISANAFCFMFLFHTLRIHPVAVTGSSNLLCCILQYFSDFAFYCCVI